MKYLILIIIQVFVIMLSQLNFVAVVFTELNFFISIKLLRIIMQILSIFHSYGNMDSSRKMYFF